MGKQRIRVYAWEFPVRLTHWVNFLCILTFIATGLYIGGPYIYSNPSEAFVMNYARVAHFIAGYAFFCSMLIRFYWAVMGNKYAGWRVWAPFTPQRFSDLMDAFRFYTFTSRKPPYAVGHTALAGLTYGVMFLIFTFAIFSGFAMLSLSSKSAFPAAVGGWMFAIFDAQMLRLLHHMVTYVIAAFLMVHLYIAWWLDCAEKNGVMGSIFGGFKFVTGKEWE
jgi:Ni/Fe-hydrogenase 1 B-type cytochrome subunit